MHQPTMHEGTIDVCEPDPATAAFYSRYARDGAIGAEAPRSAISAFFKLAFRAGAKVLDVGAGSGRDLAALCEDGYDAFGIEPNQAMRAHALQRRPALASRLLAGALPLAGTPFGGGFDGVVCNAVIMHVRADALSASWHSLRAVLAPRGRVLLSLPRMRPDLLEHDRDRDGRLFQNHAPERLVSIAQDTGFVRIELGDQARTVLPEVSWTVLLFEANA